MYRHSLYDDDLTRGPAPDDNLRSYHIGDDGELFVIYDKTNEDAWIEAGATVDLDRFR